MNTTPPTQDKSSSSHCQESVMLQVPLPRRIIGLRTPADEPCQRIPLADPDARNELLHAFKKREFPTFKPGRAVGLQGGRKALISLLRQSRKNMISHVKNLKHKTRTKKHRQRRVYYFNNTVRSLSLSSLSSSSPSFGNSSTLHSSDF